MVEVMGKMMQKVKSMLHRPKRSKSAQKAYDRWEGEGGALAPDEFTTQAPKPPEK